ncbi:MAG TPA: tetratricopeptide repeat protein [Spirochaetia bacterium]|nr:tetratricopeptide repeat protein [Spirochaetia bacterium]
MKIRFLRIIPFGLVLFSCSTMAPQSVIPSPDTAKPGKNEGDTSLITETCGLTEGPAWEDIPMILRGDAVLQDGGERLPLPSVPSLQFLPPIPEPEVLVSMEPRVFGTVDDSFLVPEEPRKITLAVPKAEEQKDTYIPQKSDIQKKPEESPVKKQEKPEQQKPPVRSVKETENLSAPETSSQGVVKPITNENVRERSVVAKLFDTVLLTFDGPGWIFVGEAEGKAGLSYTSRDTSNQARTGFSFKARETGEYVLVFQRQDLSVAMLSMERVKVSVLDEKDFLAAVNAKKVGEADGSSVAVSAGNLGTGDSLYAAKKYPEAYAAYLNGYTPGNPFLENRLGELAFSLGRFSEAVDHWSKNLTVKDGNWQALALRGIFDASVRGRLQDSLIFSAERLLSSEDSFSRGDLVAVVTALKELKDFEKAIRFCESYVSRYPFIKGIDEVYYLLGTLYEEQGSQRSEQKAVSYYRIVTENYPASQFWQKARDRILFIERNYLFIR